MLNGQWCAGISRIFTHESVATSLIEKVTALFAATKLGLASDEATEMGPLSHKQHLDKMEAIFAQLVQRGGKPHRSALSGDLPAGHFFPPTLVSGIEDDPKLCEVFGPLATVHSFQDIAQAIRLANTKPLLQCYIFSKDSNAAMKPGRALHCGSVMVNGVGFGFEMPEGSEDPSMALFGGSGLGVEAGMVCYVDFFAGWQNVGVNGSSS